MQTNQVRLIDELRGLEIIAERTDSGELVLFEREPSEVLWSDYADPRPEIVAAAERELDRRLAVGAA